jgi:hypothetical protein
MIDTRIESSLKIVVGDVYCVFANYGECGFFMMISLRRLCVYFVRKYA